SPVSGPGSPLRRSEASRKPGDSDAEFRITDAGSIFKSTSAFRSGSRLAHSDPALESLPEGREVFRPAAAVPASPRGDRGLSTLVDCPESSEGGLKPLTPKPL